ncbi:Peroxisomal acyl-coenzyme A oxidase 1 [Phytophthora rubi]|uniref:Acyl-coenzyme A oxidase n=1 Tax=Phytophthora rubi TaxID=129364 RepID=A0A6A4FMY2_9STRA|nr:Peroxisomal acyl-coenzyme A oxidase 1 [Phytophthora rubi]
MATELKDLAPLLLQRERDSNGDIDVELLTNTLRGGHAANVRRKNAEAAISQHLVLSKREAAFQNHTERYNSALSKTFHYVKLIQSSNVDSDDQQIMYDAIGEKLPIQVHRSMFIPTLENQADDEQQAHWLPLATSYRILGAYAQTELGHGSNVQGLETTAVYDKNSQEFTINSPTLTSRKWWPGGLGKTATHAVVHAQLRIGGQHKGVQAFIVPLRSLKDHAPLPGVEVGDIGPKVGFNSLDNGYAVFRNVRIPRRNMLMRYAKVLPDGTFIKPPSSKLVYLTMTQIRAYLILKLGLALGAATTITTRFSAVRVQGRKVNTSGSDLALTTENPVLDYQNQQHALLPLVALSYAANFAGRAMVDMHDKVLAMVTSGQPDFAAQSAELHAISSGLKGWLADHVNDGIEHCRRLCGGHGFLQSSNLAHIFAESVGACTYEGTADVLVQQHARYLLKQLGSLRPSHPQDAEAPADFLSRSDFYANPKLRCSASNAAEFGSFKVLVEAFEVRAARSVRKLAHAMKASGDSANTCMMLVTTASTHHTELLLLKSFISGVSLLPVGSTKFAVTQLCQLFGVWLLVNGLGDFRHDDYISSSQADLAHQQLANLLPLVRRNVVRLTDAWDFSDFELNSALGRFDGDIYRALVDHAEREPLNASQVPEGYDKYLRPLIKSAL